MRIEKVVVNIGIEAAKLENAFTLLQRMTGKKPVKTRAKDKIPTWGVKKGEEIGCMVTLRRDEAVKFLKRAFVAVENKLKKSCFENGNISFGIREYIDFPDVKYDPKIGIIGLSVMIKLERPGYRIARRRIQTRKIPRKHRITREEAMEFIKKNFKVKIE